MGFKKIIIENLYISKKIIHLWDFLTLVSLVALFTYRLNKSVEVPYYLILSSYIWISTVIVSVFFFSLFILFHLPVKRSSNSRRDFLRKAVGAGSLGTIGAASSLGVASAYKLKLEKISLKVENKFKSLRGLKILQLSDLHFGPILKEEFAHRILETIGDTEFDLLVITGDLVDGLPRNLRNDIEPLRALKAPLGQYYVLGNHEYYWGAQSWVDFSKTMNWTPLLNENKKILFNDFPLEIIGVTDKAAYRTKSPLIPDYPKAFNNLEQDSFKLVLSHRPKNIFNMEQYDFNLMLSGHTHSGQGFPYSLIVKMVQPYSKGLYKHKGKNLYVNSATGFWGPPYRLGQNGEITLIELT